MERDLTIEEAVSLHRQMWSDMKAALGNRPEGFARVVYKQKWCEEHGYEDVYADCFLCEYVEKHGKGDCLNCPIDWGEGDCMFGNVVFSRSPIDEILALPEREMQCT